MQIDWKDGKWRVFRIGTTELLDEAPHVVLMVRSELVIVDGGTHGWLIVSGTLERKGDTLFIR